MSLSAVCRCAQQLSGIPLSCTLCMCLGQAFVHAVGYEGKSKVTRNKRGWLTHLGRKLHVEFPQEHCHGCRNVDFCKLLPQAIPAGSSKTLLPKHLHA